MLSAAWLAGVLLGLSSGLATAALLLAGAAGLVAVGLRLARLPAFPALLAAVLLLGLAWAEASQAAGSAPDALAGREVAAVGRIADDPESTATRVRFELQVSQVLLNGESRDVSERWLVYANPPDDVVARREAPFFRYGDAVTRPRSLTARGMPQEPQPIDGFDYPAYLAAQGITATLFAQETQVTGAGPGAGCPLCDARRSGCPLRARLLLTVSNAPCPSPSRRWRQRCCWASGRPGPGRKWSHWRLRGEREANVRLPGAHSLVDKFRLGAPGRLTCWPSPRLHVGVRALAVTSGAAAWLLGRSVRRG